MPQIGMYDDSKDHVDHNEIYKAHILLQGTLDEIICRAFSIMLKGPTRQLFENLQPNSISSFKRLTDT